jgi:thiol-disulfide isomerase/thioredoxin
MATHSPVSQGKVSLSRLAANNPLKAKISAQGRFFPSGSDEVTPFHSTFDGTTLRKLRPKERTLVVKSLTDGDPKERTLGFITGFLGGGAYQLLMLEYVQDSPLARQAEASVADYEGRTVVDRVLCHVIYVEYPSATTGRIFRERWYIGAKDNLPRKVEQIVMSDDGRSGAYTLTVSNVIASVPVPTSTFTMQVPKGYVVKPYEPPAYPDLLGLGTPAPDWKLIDPSGNVHSLSDYRGKIVVLDFWATWCGPCIRAMPGLQKAYQDYKDRGVVVFGVNAWEESNAVEFMKRSGYTYGLLLNGEQAAAAYRVSTLPTLYVINVDGTIIHRLSGIDDNLGMLIERYLKDQGR